MLVLSRRPGQKIVFPGLGVTIEVLRAKGAVTRLGIEAPAAVEVLRAEIQRDAPEASPAVTPESRHAAHERRNRLNTLMLKLQLLQRQLETGRDQNPAAELAALCQDLSELEGTTDDPAPTGGRPLRVLVVEDQANERELFARCLSLSGLEVAQASDGRAAFDYLHEHELPDLLLLDMRMPGLDGPELLRLIRDDVRLQTLKVFAVSGSAREEFAETLPVDGWFPKPVRIDALLTAVQATTPPRTIMA
jgi:carbon storage regulator CsrA